MQQTAKSLSHCCDILVSRVTRIGESESCFYWTHDGYHLRNFIPNASQMQYMTSIEITHKTSLNLLAWVQSSGLVDDCASVGMPENALRTKLRYLSELNMGHFRGAS